MTASFAGDAGHAASTSDAYAQVVVYVISAQYDQGKVSNGGSTIPIKLQLSNASGANVSSPSVTLNALRLVNTSTNAVYPVQDSGNANPGGNFRFDGGGYIFNLNTKGLPAGGYKLVFTVSGDPTLHTLSFQLR